ncbi:hypothetical protein EDC96DRAFT_545856 [Choanephora cucurbitarum]|nr:hypothetical protein EDC96DRAFT_545856 [Choanephora cucurbitarum]
MDFVYSLVDLLVMQLVLIQEHIPNKLGVCPESTTICLLSFVFHSRTRFKHATIDASKTILLFVIITDVHGSTNKIKPLMVVPAGGKSSEFMNSNYNGFFSNSKLNLLDRNWLITMASVKNAWITIRNNSSSGIISRSQLVSKTGPMYFLLSLELLDKEKTRTKLMASIVNGKRVLLGRLLAVQQLCVKVCTTKKYLGHL